MKIFQGSSLYERTPSYLQGMLPKRRLGVPVDETKDRWLSLMLHVPTSLLWPWASRRPGRGPSATERTRQIRPRRGRTQVPLLLATITLLGCESGSLPSHPEGSRTAGARIEQRLQSKWNAYKFQSEPIMAQQLSGAIKSQPLLTQVGAIEHAFMFASELEIQQRLRPGDAQTLVADMKIQFPHTRALLAREIAH